MNRKFIRDISANTAQVIIVQCCGLVIFYLLSTRLDKNEFGEINWALAVLMTAFGILSFGIDQVSIKRFASGNNAKQLLSIYCMHVLAAGTIFYIMLWISDAVFSSFFGAHHLLLILGLAKLMIFFSTPFKQLANGLERFKPLLIMSVCSNVLRSITLIIFAYLDQIDLNTVVIIFIAGDVAELLLCVVITQFIIKVGVSPRWNKKEYKDLVTEALPQFGVSVFSSALARFDWIFLGLLAGNIILADYSFAYKVFEVATLPMLIIAPVLIPRFTKLFHPSATEITATKKADLFILLRIEMIIAALAALVLNILWVPVIDLLTQGKYGAVNKHTILLLSASMPFLFFNNFLWTINFAKGRLKMIFYIFLACFLVNLAGDLILIPLFKAEGAAIAYLAAIIVQSVLYFQQTKMEGLKQNSYAILLCPAFALLSAGLAYLFFTDTVFIMISSLIIYFLCLVVSRQIRFADWLAFKRITGI
ncbi:MAG: oligosaccharide flippase family protein [Ferruginibacter sp.]